jgi:hypothetical protein
LYSILKAVFSMILPILSVLRVGKVFGQRTGPGPVPKALGGPGYAVPARPAN